jgi:hypothetical protein
MSITKANVVDVLKNSPVLARICFHVGEITVDNVGYQKVREYIEHDQIAVVPGNDAVAFYDGNANTLITQAGKAPLSDGDKAQIVHECTHAMIDIRGIRVRRLVDEVAANLAQTVYLWMLMPVGTKIQPHGFIPLHVPGHPHAHMTFAMRDVMAKYELHTSRGFGARIGERDIWDLMLAITTAPEYRTIKWDEISAGRGVRIKENTMWGLREALRNAKVQRAK